MSLPIPPSTMTSAVQLIALIRWRRPERPPRWQDHAIDCCDPYSCNSTSATGAGRPEKEILIMLHSGKGKMQRHVRAESKVNSSATPNSVIGDGAVWVAETREVNARKNDLLARLP